MCMYVSAKETILEGGVCAMQPLMFLTAHIEKYLILILKHSTHYFSYLQGFFY